MTFLTSLTLKSLQIIFRVAAVNNDKKMCGEFQLCDIRSNFLLLCFQVQKYQRPRNDYFISFWQPQAQLIYLEECRLLG
jgi:hypothetical protein